MKTLAGVIVLAAVLGAMVGCGKTDEGVSENAPIPSEFTGLVCQGDEKTVCKFTYTLGSGPVYAFNVPKDVVNEYTIQNCINISESSCFNVYHVTCNAITGCVVSDLSIGGTIPAAISTDENQKVVSFQDDFSIVDPDDVDAFFRIQALGGGWVKGEVK